MSALISLFVDLTTHPYSTAIIFANLWIWNKAIFDEWDQRLRFLTYQEVFEKMFYWKLIPVSFTNPTVLILFINISSVWNMRVLETYFGPFGMLKNTLWILALNTAFASLTMNYVLKFIPGEFHRVFQLTNIHSCSSLVLGWATYQAFRMILSPTVHSEWQYFLFTGFVLVPTEIIPLILFVSFTLFSSRLYHFSYFVGVLSGLSLALGLENAFSEIYWMTWFFFDVTVLFLLSLTLSSTISREYSGLFRRSITRSDTDDILLIECLDMPEIQASEELYQQSSSFYSPGDLEMGFIRGRGSDVFQREEDAEDTQPLLRTQNRRQEHTVDPYLTGFLRNPREVWRNLTSFNHREGYSELQTDEVELTSTEIKEDDQNSNRRSEDIIYDR